MWTATIAVQIDAVDEAAVARTVAKITEGIATAAPILDRGIVQSSIIAVSVAVEPSAE